MPIWAWLLLITFLGVIITTAILWAKISYDTFPNTVKPGEEYEIDGKTYRVPNLPHKRYGSKEVAKLDSTVPMLDKKFLTNLRTFVIDIFDLLRESQTEFWVTGGTLLSAEMWGHLMCYDDDCDISVHWKDREYLWSDEFSTLAALRGFETFYLPFASLKKATREGACMRLRRKDTQIPTIDIFFSTPMEDGSFAKVNTWNGGRITVEKRETWPSPDWIYPIQEKDIDGMKWSMPNQPQKMLKQQYGEDWNTTIQSPAPMTKSHKFAFMITNFFHVWSIGKVLDTTDVSQLVNRS